MKGISTEVVFVNQLSGNAGISDLRIVWVKRNCRFIIYIFNPVYHFAPYSNVLERTLFLNILGIPHFERKKEKKKINCRQYHKIQSEGEKKDKHNPKDNGFPNKL